MPEWSETTLDSCVALTKGVTYAAADYADKGQGHPFLTIKSVKKGGGFNEEGLKYYKGPYKPAQAVKPGDLLVALTDLTRVGDIIGSPFRVPELGATVVLPSMDLAVLREGDEPINFSFLAHRLMLHDARRYMLARSAGTTVLHLDSKAALKFSFLRPKPEAQERIAEILSTVDEAIEQTEALIAKIQQIKAGLMHDLFTRGVTPDGQLRPPREEAPQLYKESPLGWIPKEWGLGVLGDYLDPITGIKPGPFGSSLTKDVFVEKGYRVYGQEQVIAESLATGNYYIGVTKFAEMKVFEVSAGDILLSLVGTVGRVLIVQAPFEAGIINPRLIRLRPDPKLASSQFLRYILLTDSIKRQTEALAGGGTMPVINGKVIRRLLVPKIDIDEQILLVDRLSAVEAEVSSAQADLGKLMLIKSGLMSDLLSGGVEVPLTDIGEREATG